MVVESLLYEPFFRSSLWLKNIARIDRIGLWLSTMDSWVCVPWRGDLRALWASDWMSSWQGDEIRAPIKNFS